MIYLTVNITHHLRKQLKYQKYITQYVHEGINVLNIGQSLIKIPFIYSHTPIYVSAVVVV